MLCNITLCYTMLHCTLIPSIRNVMQHYTVLHRTLIPSIRNVMQHYTVLHYVTPHLDPINQKAVNDVDGDVVVHDREEEGEEPAEGDHGQNL